MTWHANASGLLFESWARCALRMEDVMLAKGVPDEHNVQLVDRLVPAGQRSVAGAYPYP